MNSWNRKEYQQLESDVLFHNREVLESVGISVGIIRQDDTFFFSSGSLHKDSGYAINQDSLFEIGSITKTFTALLISLAIGRHAIALDAYIDKLLPNSAKLRSSILNKVKVTDLASHQSGLPTLADDHYLDSLLRMNAGQPFAIVGTHYIQQVLNNTDCLNNYGVYQYSNFAYALLGLMAEHCTGLSYENALAAQLTGPLSMTRTGLTSPLDNNQVGCYTQQGDVAERLIANKVAPAGGLHSTAADLINYLKAQISPGYTPLGRAIELSHKPFCVANGYEVGLGWNIINNGTHRYFEKTGDSFGNSSLLRFDKQNKTGLVVLSNHQNSSLVAKIADELYSDLL